MIQGASVYGVAKSEPLDSFPQLPWEAVLAAFREISSETAQELLAIDVGAEGEAHCLHISLHAPAAHAAVAASLQAEVGAEVLRRDIFDVLARALGRELSGVEIGAVTK